MKQTYKITLFLFSIFAFIFVLEHPITSASDLPLIDLSEYSDEDGFYENLNGEWMFFEEELLTPEESADRLNKAEGRLVPIPSSFASLVGKSNTYGTYSTKVKVSDTFIGKTLAIHIPYQYSAYSLYNDDVEIGKNGVVGTSEATHVSEMSPKSGYFKVNNNEFILTMHISSFNYTDGGFQNTIFLGDSASVTRTVANKMATTLFLTGCIFIIGLFMFFFALYRRQERLFLVFGLFAMLIAARALFAVPFYYTLFMPDISWRFGTKLEYLLTELTTMTFVTLLWMWYKDDFSKKVLYGLITLLSALLLVTVFTRPLIFQPLFLKMFYLSIPFFFYIVYIVLKNLRTHSSYATMNLIGITIVFVAFFNDFAIANDWYDSGRFMLLAVGIYVFMHFVIMSKGFAQSVKETEELNAQLFALNTSLDRRVQERTAQLNKVNEDLKELALTDGLTGIYNRHSFNEFMEKAFKKAQEKQLSLSVLMLDLDYFKKYNDHFGHVAGDELLKKLVKIVVAQLPQNSFFARYGGEEFVIVLPNMTCEETYEIAELVRHSVEEANIEHPQSEIGFVTYSIGAATMNKGEVFNSAIELIDIADKRLYEAKQGGRNQIA